MTTKKFKTTKKSVCINSYSIEGVSIKKYKLLHLLAFPCMKKF